MSETVPLSAEVHARTVEALRSARARGLDEHATARYVLEETHRLIVAGELRRLASEDTRRLAAFDEIASNHGYRSFGLMEAAAQVTESRKRFLARAEELES